MENPINTLVNKFTNADSYLNKTGKDGKSLIASSTKWIAAAWLLVVLCLSFV